MVMGKEDKQLTVEARLQNSFLDFLRNAALEFSAARVFRNRFKQ